MFNRKYLKATNNKKKYKEYSAKNDRYNEITEYMKNEEYEKALDLLVEFIVNYPDDYYGRYDYALCLIRTGNPEPGILELEMIRKKFRKRGFAVYKTIIDYYLRNCMFDRVEELLDEADKLLTNFESKYLKIKYYYTVGRSSDANVLIEELNLKNESEKAKISVLKMLMYRNGYMRLNKSKIEKEVNYYLRKGYISKEAARKIYLKLYLACLDYEKAYEYIETNLSKGVKSLLISYEVCNKLGKKFEAQKYLNLINSFELPENSTLVRAQVLYINDKKNEAFELLKKYALVDLEAASLLCDYGIKLGRIDEIIEVMEKLLDERYISNAKTVNIIQRLCGLYIYQKRYQEAYNLLDKSKAYFSSTHKEEYFSYLCKQLNIWHTPDTSVKTYTVQQLREYSYERTVRHIERHNHDDNTKYIHTVFNEALSGNDLIEMVRPYLTKENLYELGIVEKYEVDCSNLGINEKNIIVGKIANTDDILFCFPARYYVDELDEDEELEDVKIKQISPLTKFKNKYNI